METTQVKTEGVQAPHLEYTRDCPSRTVVEVLASKWALYVLGLLELEGRALRFTELKRAIDGVSQKSLTQTLRALERDGLLSRTIYPVIPPHVDYELTPLGREAGQLMRSITRWTAANAERIHGARQAFDERPDTKDHGSRSR
jgi:DNA-binding HxlR family transcriptional regulator